MGTRSHFWPGYVSACLTPCSPFLYRRPVLPNTLYSLQASQSWTQDKG